MKVLVADKISPKGVAYLRTQPGLEVIEAYGSSPEKILELVKDVHAIAVRSETKITAAVFAAAPLLKVVGRAGVGDLQLVGALARGELPVGEVHRRRPRGAALAGDPFQGY